MDQSSTFARHFSRLVWLLMNESDSVDEQKMALRALVQASKVGAVEFAAVDTGLRTREELLPSVLNGVEGLSTQMMAHSVRSLRVTEETGPADLLGLARIFAGAARAFDGGERVREILKALGATGISIKPIDASEHRAGEAVVAAPPAAAGAPLSDAPATPVTTPAVPPESAIPAPAPTPEAPKTPRASLEAKKISEASAALLAQLSGRVVTTLSPQELFEVLDKAAASKDIAPTSKFLDDVVTLAEHTARTGKPKVVAELMHGAITRQKKVADLAIRAVFSVAIKKMAKPALLRSVASLIIKAPEQKQVAYEVLEATQEEGAEAVIEQVGQARSPEERRSLVEVLVELQDAVPALIRMLGDSRWFVVRNAADLLGEMVATKAQDALMNLLRHTDERVRRSATNALQKLGTTDAVKAVLEAVHDQSPEVRLQAAASMSTRKDSKTSATLIRAIDGESDGEVQLAMIAALGKVGTPDAVQKLVKLAEAENRLFRKKDSGLRVAAVLALGEARSPVALNALKELVDDKDKDVRETATRTLAQVGR
jgi:HEAT repeat protein